MLLQRGLALIPERLHLAKLGAGYFRPLQQLARLGLLSSDYSPRVSTLIDLFGHDALEGREIIESAKRVLQVLKCRKSCPSTLDVSGEEAHENSVA
jgi:hypothetical protein